jgi:hypothetical protein
MVVMSDANLPYVQEITTESRTLLLSAATACQAALRPTSLSKSLVMVLKLASRERVLSPLTSVQYRLQPSPIPAPSLCSVHGQHTL